METQNTIIESGAFTKLEHIKATCSDIMNELYQVIFQEKNAEMIYNMLTMAQNDYAEYGRGVFLFKFPSIDAARKSLHDAKNSGTDVPFGYIPKAGLTTTGLEIAAHRVATYDPQTSFVCVFSIIFSDDGVPPNQNKAITQSLTVTPSRTLLPAE